MSGAVGTDWNLRERGLVGGSGLLMKVSLEGHDDSTATIQALYFPVCKVESKQSPGLLPWLPYHEGLTSARSQGKPSFPEGAFCRAFGHRDKKK